LNGSPQTKTVTVARTSPQATTPMGQAMSGGMMNASSTSGSWMMAGTQLAKLTIQHVQKGCHVWSNGQTTATMMRLHLKPGQKLSILDMDVDAHQMMEFAGPMHLRMGGPMMMNHDMTISFAKKGVYRLGTKTVEMPGGSMNIKTVGPDNKLRLVVTVA
jgi:hypothetical protein